MDELDKAFLDGDIGLNFDLIKVHLNYLAEMSDKTDSVLSAVVSENISSALDRLSKLEGLIGVIQDA